MIHLDTQVVVWLASKRTSQLSDEAQRHIGRMRGLTISPHVLVEIEILIEIGRIKAPSAFGMFEALADQVGLRLSSAAAADVARAACGFAWTRDPFDRLIVANAIADGARLVTADERIREHFGDAVW